MQARTHSPQTHPARETKFKKVEINYQVIHKAEIDFMAQREL